MALQHCVIDLPVKWHLAVQSTLWHLAAASREDEEEPVLLLTSYQPPLPLHGRSLLPALLPLVVIFCDRKPLVIAKATAE